MAVLILRRPRRRRIPDRRPPAAPAKKGKKKPTKQSSVEDPAFADGYRAAYATIYQRNDYAAAIEQLKALGRDDVANVANLIGYSYRKLGDYRLSQIWYERALKADPNHVLTWQYYGLWQIEQGNRDSAQYHLSRIAAICGTACEEYRSLAAALEQARAPASFIEFRDAALAGAPSGWRARICLIHIDGYRQPGDSNI